MAWKTLVIRITRVFCIGKNGATSNIQKGFLAILQ